MSFTGKTCIVTGGANGIGRCIVESFLNQGANVAFIDLDGAFARQLSLTLPSYRFLFTAGDLTSEAVLKAFTQEVIARYHCVDCLVNNACVSRKGILSGCGFDEFNEVLKLGVTAPYLLTKLFLNAFSSNASVVNIASTRGFMSQKDTESYSAAKGGILALTHALSISLRGKVRVNSISPGWIDTSGYQNKKHSVPAYSASDKAQHPCGRIGNPKDIAEAVLFLCSEKSGFITGENITIDGGMTKQMIYHGDEGWTYSPPSE
ncbi:MAG: SDR family oxidoreductase [Christensenellales bacterium]